MGILPGGHGKPNGNGLLDSKVIGEVKILSRNKQHTQNSFNLMWAHLERH